MTSNTSEAVAMAAEQTLTPAELERARLYLGQTRNEIAGAVRYLSDSQWKFKPAADRWSIAEIVEHVIIVQERVLGPIREELEIAPVVGAHPNYKNVDDIIIYQFPNRLSKFPSPIQPSADLDRAQAMDRLLTNYSRLSECLETKQGLRTRSLESPPLKAVSNGVYDQMDGYQWILAAAAHTERHTKQVLEVMADPAFPS